MQQRYDRQGLFLALLQSSIYVVELMIPCEKYEGSRSETQVKLLPLKKRNTIPF